MPKKFFDILPPNQGKPGFFSRSADIQKEKSESSSKKDASSRSPGRKNQRNKSLAVIFSILILVGIFSYFNFREAKIEIRPVSEVLDFKEEVIANAKITESDPSSWAKERVFPGKFLEEEKEISRQFSSSGVKTINKKAKGTIRVYNNYKNSANFRSSTRFLTAEGKLFRSEKKVYIPAGGFTDVKVEAAETGPDYNIKPSTFSIPGLVGYASYTSIYGKSLTPMTGGFLGEISYVSQDDLEKAENILTKELKREGKEILKKKVGTEYVLLEKAIKQEVTEASSLAPVGAEVEKFDFQVKIKSKAIVFKKEDLKNFAKGFIFNRIKSSQKIYEDSLRVNYFPQSINLEKGIIDLSLEFSAKVYSRIDIFSMKKSLFGKSLREAWIILENQPQIAGVRIKLWPFWVKSIPKDREKIKITLKLD